MNKDFVSAQALALQLIAIQVVDVSGPLFSPFFTFSIPFFSLSQPFLIQQLVESKILPSKKCLYCQCYRREVFSVLGLRGSRTCFLILIPLGGEGKQKVIQSQKLFWHKVLAVPTVVERSDFFCGSKLALVVLQVVRRTVAQSLYKVAKTPNFFFFEIYLFLL